jgi:hypothetical protein
MTKKKSSSYSHLGVFALFVMASALLWFVFKYSDKFSDEQTLDLKLVNVPIDLRFKEQTEEITIPVTMAATGYNLIYYKFFNPDLNLSFSDYFTVEDSLAVLNKPATLNFLNENLGEEVDIIAVNQDSVVLPLQIMRSTYIPLKLNANIEAKDGYRVQGDPILIPDSVLVTGTKKQISEVDSIITISGRIMVDRETTSKRIQLKNFIDLAHDPDTVLVQVTAIRMTEKSIIKSIQIVNQPSDTRIKLIPTEVTITYRGPLKGFDKIQTSSITPVIDLKDFDSDNFSTIPKLQGVPDRVSDYRITPGQVQVLVIK